MRRGAPAPATLSPGRPHGAEQCAVRGHCSNMHSIRACQSGAPRNLDTTQLAREGQTSLPAHPPAELPPTVAAAKPRAWLGQGTHGASWPSSPCMQLQKVHPHRSCCPPSASRCLQATVAPAWEQGGSTACSACREPRGTPRHQRPRQPACHSFPSLSTAPPPPQAPPPPGQPPRRSKGATMRLALLLLGLLAVSAAAKTQDDAPKRVHVALSADSGGWVDPVGASGPASTGPVAAAWGRRLAGRCDRGSRPGPPPGHTASWAHITQPVNRGAASPPRRRRPPAVSKAINEVLDAVREEGAKAKAAAESFAEKHPTASSPACWARTPRRRAPSAAC